MWLLFVVLLLQVSEKLPLKLVDVFYVAEDGLQLQLGEHVRVFAALADVTLKENRYSNASHAGQQGELVGPLSCGLYLLMHLHHRCPSGV